MTRHYCARTLLFSIAMVAGLSACQDRATLGPDRGLPASLSFSASGPAYVRTLVITVTGPGIDSALVFNIPVASGSASGTISVPAGSQRRVVAQAYDSVGVNTHRADTTVTLQPGTGTQVSLVLLPLLGDLPVVLNFGTLSFAIAPNDTAISLGDSTLFAAVITDRQGRTLAGVRPHWATANPAVATVDTLTGYVKGRRAGTTVVVATYGGASATRNLQVIAGPVAALSSNYMRTCSLNVSGHIYCWGATYYGSLTSTTYASPTPVLLDGSRTYKALSVGYWHSCALATDGSAYCWGRNDYGQLGDGTTATPKNTPVAVAGGLTFMSIGAGQYHTCGLATTGVVYCWGDNGNGQLGNASSTGSSAPIANSGDLRFTSLTVGWNHQCGFAPGGIAYCWGYNASGRLGDGTTTNRATPTPVSGGLAFQSIVAHTNLTCGLVSGGDAYCWGANTNGKLGDGTTTARSTPTAVTGGLSFQSIQPGEYQSCGLTLSGAAYCWGYNGYGQLGDGTRTSSNTPVAVTGGQVFQSISVGYLHACGVSIYGRTYCWGGDMYGQLGTGADSTVAKPMPVSGGLAFASLSTNGNATCGITTANVGYCWGSNASGQLGTGTTTDVSVPTAITGSYTWLALHVGVTNACGLSATGGTVYCWGNNNIGQLGDGTNTAHSAPAAVSGTFASLASGDGWYHECALTSAGAAYCWGLNSNGQLGDGTTISHNVPTAVQQGGLVFNSIVTGFYNTCALTTADAAYCWGANGGYQVGDGSTTNRSLPTAVQGGLTFASLAVGYRVACGLTAGGSAYCWGNGWNAGWPFNWTGQPTLITGFTFTSIAAGDDAVCGTTSGGTTYCWGSNNQGQLGIGSWASQDSYTPAAVTGSQVLMKLAAGSWQACGLTSAGAAYCWGWNGHGQLGRGTVAVSTAPVAVAVPSTTASILAPSTVFSAFEGRSSAPGRAGGSPCRGGARERSPGRPDTRCEGIL